MVTTDPLKPVSPSSSSSSSQSGLSEIQKRIEHDDEDEGKDEHCGAWVVDGKVYRFFTEFDRGEA